MSVPDASSTTAPQNHSAARRRPRRWLPWVGALAVVALIAAGLWPRPLPVELAAVALGPLRATVNEEGKTRIKQRYVVAAPVAGQLRRIDLKAGAEVRAGETVVAIIDPPAPTKLDARSRAAAEARREAASAHRERARAQHRFATLDLQRAEKLAGDKTLSVQELENVQWRETAAAKDLAAAESTLRQVEAELAEFETPTRSNSGSDHTRPPTEVRAPATGRVLRVFEASARTIPAGIPLMEIGDPTDLEVVIETLSRDGAGLVPGTRVLLEHWGGDTSLEARVRLVEPAAFTKVSALGVEEQRVNVVADIQTPVEKRRGLGDSFRVEARIVVWESERTLKVASGALFRRGPDWMAFVVAEGRAQLRTVKPGRSSSTETQILDGLKEGEQLILYPGDRIREGQRVKAIKI